ncbi:MAG: hypothetical protein GMKNLPBB_02213 [Myxococcota bacterium]|nr:hypothetical protein [Myxococcota bacterium]
MQRFLLHRVINESNDQYVRGWGADDFIGAEEWFAPVRPFNDDPAPDISRQGLDILYAAAGFAVRVHVIASPIVHMDIKPMAKPRPPVP